MQLHHSQPPLQTVFRAFAADDSDTYAAPSTDPAILLIAHIQSPGVAANFRAAPSCKAQS
jgi:hypothetical protein